RAQHLAILGQVDVVGDLGRVIDGLDGHGSLHLFSSPPLAGEVASAASRRGDVRSSTGHWPLPPRFAWSPSPASGGGKASSHSPHVERRLLAGAVAFERALVADGVGALEDPVLPGG